MIFSLLTISIVMGQLIKIPIGSVGGVTLLDITIVFLSLLILPQKIKTLRISKITKAFLIFITVAFISLIFSPLDLSFSQFMNSLAYLLRLILIYLMAYLIYDHKKILPSLTYSGIAIASLGLIQLIFIPDLLSLENLGWDPHYFRVVSTFLDPNFTGAFCILTLLLIYQQSFPKNIKKVLFLIVFLSLLATFSRGAYLMFAISFFSLSLLRKSLKLFLLTLFLSLTLLSGFYIYQQTIALPRNINREKSASYRINSWQQGWQLFNKSPLTGVGFNAYRFGLEKYQLASKPFLDSRGSTSNDSSLLFILSTAGILGLGSFIYFLTTIINLAWQKHLKKTLRATILLSALAGLLVHSFFANSLFYPFIFLWIILLTSSLDSDKV